MKAGEQHKKRKCQCQGAWDGDTCEDQTCMGYESTLCKNGIYFKKIGGTCYVDGSPKTRKCRCEKGFGGDTCQDEVCPTKPPICSGSSFLF